MYCLYAYMYIGIYIYRYVYIYIYTYILFSNPPMLVIALLLGDSSNPPRTAGPASGARRGRPRRAWNPLRDEAISK